MGQLWVGTAIITFTYLLTMPLCIWSWTVQESWVGNVQLKMSRNFLALAAVYACGWDRVIQKFFFFWKEWCCAFIMLDFADIVLECGRLERKLVSIPIHFNCRCSAAACSAGMLTFSKCHAVYIRLFLQKNEKKTFMHFRAIKKRGGRTCETSTVY